MGAHVTGDGVRRVDVLGSRVSRLKWRGLAVRLQTWLIALVAEVGSRSYLNVKQVLENLLIVEGEKLQCSCVVSERNDGGRAKRYFLIFRKKENVKILN